MHAPKKGVIRRGDAFICCQVGDAHCGISLFVMGGAQCNLGGV